jgi:hypothetical protein
MKNIHILPTDKPSRLWTNNLKRRLELDEFTSQHPTNIAKNIYITSDEEIKEGDWHFKNDKMVTKSHIIDNTCKKIILTTDQDLIADGVQAIDDEFLEWFVMNPSCEYVEVVKYDGYLHFKYMVITPQKEPKQLTDLEKEMFELEQELDIPSSMRWHNSKPKQEIKLEDIFNDEKKQGVKDLIDAHKQETLEEVAERIAYDSTEANKGFHSIKMFIKGAKWMQERTCNHNYILTSEQSIRIIKCLKCNNVQSI